MWNLLDRLGRRHGPLTVAYSGTPVVFPLFGPRLSNRVVYVPISGDDRPQPVALHQGDSVYLRLAEARRGRMDEQFWLAGLRERGVDLLYLVDDPKTGGVGQELGVVRQHPETFQRLVETGGVHLFRLRGR